jgi:fructokinase
MSEFPGRLYGAVEGGGTKFVLAIGDETGRLLIEERFATAHPATTLPRMVAWLEGQVQLRGPLAAIGVGSFGPVELRRESPQYGCILKTPKADWSGTDILGPLARAFDCPIGFDTDVNGAALAEHRWGGAQDVADLVYVTVGTGIGGGIVIAGRPVHGLLHPEVGHIYPRRHAKDAAFTGVCPFHGDCLEGLASGPAIVARSGAALEQLDPAHVQWEIEADYLAQLCAQLTLTVSPRRLLLGGGVMQQSRLLPLIRGRLRHWLGGYVDRPELAAAIDDYVIAPRLGAQAGVLGALALAIEAARGG